MVDEAVCLLCFCLNQKRSFDFLYVLEQGSGLRVGNITHEPLVYPFLLLLFNRLLLLFLLTRKTDRIISLPFIIITSLHKDYLLLLDSLLSLHMLNYIKPMSTFLPMGREEGVELVIQIGVGSRG